MSASKNSELFNSIEIKCCVSILQNEFLLTRETRFVLNQPHDENCT
jgi:hypothetical protein